MRRFAELLLAVTCLFALSLPLRADDPYIGGYTITHPPGASCYGSLCSSGRAPGHPVSGSASASVPAPRPRSLPLRNARQLPIAPQMRAQPRPAAVRWPRRVRSRSRGEPPPSSSSGGAECREFNARFTRFYQDQVRDYRGAGERQTNAEDRLRGLIADQQRLRDRLRRQAFQARQFGIRSHLMRQARAVDQDIRSKKRMLKNLKERSGNSRRQRQAEFREKTAGILKDRPPGCKVEVLASAE